MHTSYMQCEEANTEAFKRHQHRRHDVRRNSQSSLRKTNGNIDPNSQAAPISIKILKTCPGLGISTLLPVVTAGTGPLDDIHDAQSCIV